MNGSSFRVIGGVLGGLSLAIMASSTASAGVMLDPAMINGANAVDPGGARTINPDDRRGNITEAALEAELGFRTVHQFDNFDRAGTTNQNFIAFTNDMTPDIRFTVTGDVHGNTGSPASDSTYNTSPAASGTPGAYRIIGVAPQSGGDAVTTLTIDFGSYDASDGTFTADRVVGQAAFTLTNILNEVTFNVAFRDANDATLGTVQSVAGAAGEDPNNPGFSGRDAFFAYDSGGAGIGSILITRIASGNKGSTQGLDDFGFTSIPEPASVGLLTVAAAGLFLKRRRR